MSSPRIAVGPQHASFATQAVAAGGGTLVDITEQPDALVWLDPRAVQALTEQVAAAPTVRWVQLPFAGMAARARAQAAGLDRLGVGPG